jgi:hypothetical protein
VAVRNSAIVAMLAESMMKERLGGQYVGGVYILILHMYIAISLAKLPRPKLLRNNSLHITCQWRMHGSAIAQPTDMAPAPARLCVSWDSHSFFHNAEASNNLLVNMRLGIHETGTRQWSLVTITGVE